MTSLSAGSVTVTFDEDLLPTGKQKWIDCVIASLQADWHLGVIGSKVQILGAEVMAQR